MIVDDVVGIPGDAISCALGQMQIKPDHIRIEKNGHEVRMIGWTDRYQREIVRLKNCENAAI